MVTRETGLALEAWEALFRAQVSLMRGFTESPVWQGRTTKEYDVLFALSRSEEGLRQVHLAELLLVPQPSLSRILAQLCDEGLVERSPDPRDGRGHVHRLTVAGRSLQRSIGYAHAQDVTRAMTQALTEDELRTLRELATKLALAGGTPIEPA